MSQLLPEPSSASPLWSQVICFHLEAPLVITQYTCLQIRLGKLFPSKNAASILIGHRVRLVFYAWLGIRIPSVLLMTLGAAIGVTVLVVPECNDAYELNKTGRVMAAMLEPAGGFGNLSLSSLLCLSSQTQPLRFTWSPSTLRF